jgi:hypothetical protein
MRIGDVSRARRFANPARLRWYAFHRSVRFAMRMMKSCEETAAVAPAAQPPYLDCSFALEEEMNLPDDVTPR